MTARLLFVGLMAISSVAIAGPASAKAAIAEAKITGPGLRAALRIEAPDTEGLWESGIDVVGGLDDTRSDSVDELGLTPGDLGPRYVVAFRFDHGDDVIRQHLYPYTKGGPVTYTPPGQELKVGVPMQITAGWYQSSVGFFQYLVDHGLPETDPVAPVAPGEPAPDTAPGARTAPRAGIVVVVVAVAALSLAALAARRRVLGAGP